MPIEFRAIGPDELAAMRRCLGLAFSVEPDPEDRRLAECLPLARTRVGFEEGEVVSTSGAFELEMTVPGGSVPCGGTTIVSVAPTHRRRGVMSQMMRAHLDDVRDHEEPIAALWASDSAIYGRFGYGSAAICHDIEVQRGHVEPNRLSPEPAPVRVVDVGEAAKLLPPFHEEIRVGIPGYFARSDAWWEHYRLHDSKDERDGMTPYRYVVAEDDTGGMAGFAQYRARMKFENDHGAGRISVRELVATTPGAWAGLWSFLLQHDLIEKTTADLRPPWDPIFDLLAGTRRVAATRSDSLWVRIMDVPRALASRSYSAAVSVAIGVHDPLGDVTGVYRLSADDDGVECAKVSEEPEVTLDLEDLGACYMGRARFRELARSGRLTGSPPALAGLDAAFTWEPQPWCPEIF